MKFQYLAGLACLALPLLASAIEAGPSSPRQAETENWMALQLSGRAASANPRKPRRQNANRRSSAGWTATSTRFRSSLIRK